MDIDFVAPGLQRILPESATLDRVAHGMGFSEGPVWDQRTGTFYWSDIVGDTIWKHKPGIGSEPYIKPSGNSNGLTFDKEGRLVVAGWCARSIWRVEKDGSMVTLATSYEGKRLHSPNDIVVKSDGSIYWTDSPGALVIPFYQPEDTQRYLDIQGVYKLAPNSTEVELAVGDSVYPNGICFSPDESLLYVNETRQNLIRVFDVQRDGCIGPGRLFCKLQGNEEGVADGMKVDVEGNVYCTGPGGVHIFDSKGRMLGRIRMPAHTTNMAFGGDDWCSMYFTTIHSIYRTRVKIPGVAVW